ncbi:MAG: endonuclease domain-containing protein [Pseudonocardiaceae bacterium]
MRTNIRPTDICGVFRGSDAVAGGALTAEQLRAPQFRRLYRDVYLPAGMPITHARRCEGLALILPSDAAITGRSAATLRGIPLAQAIDPVEIVVPLQTRVARRSGVDVRRSDLTADESTPWSRICLASPLRTTLDLLLDRSLPEAVADLDAVLRAGLIDSRTLQRVVTERSDRGIVAARSAVELADPRAESRPESRLRVYLVLDGLEPVPQFVVCDWHGVTARVDLGFPRQRLAVEYDGEWHGEWRQISADRERLNRLQAAGWDVLFVTARQLRDPSTVVAQVRSALTARTP